MSMAIIVGKVVAPWALSDYDYRDLEKMDEAIKDFEEARKVALKLQMSKAVLERIFTGLGKSDHA